MAAHLEQLLEVSAKTGDPVHRLHAVLEAYALITNESHDHHDNELAASLHHDQHVHRAEDQLTDLVQGLIADAAESGSVRDDIPPRELASYSLHSLAAAGALTSKAAVRRLVAVTLAGLQPAD